jgi:hypothetical protein
VAPEVIQMVEVLIEIGEAAIAEERRGVVIPPDIRRIGTVIGPRISRDIPISADIGGV